MANTNAESKTERARIEDLLSWQVDGLIIAPAQETGDAGLFWELWRRKIPFVLIDRTFPETPFYSVSTEDEVGAALVVEHLIAMGRRRIARVGSPLAVSTNRLRHAGYTAALIRHGILPQAEYAIEAPPSEEGGYRALARLLALEPRPDAVFCFSDNVAIGIMEACSDQGIRVPEDLAVVGYADLPQSRLLKVSLDHGSTAAAAAGPARGRNAGRLHGRQEPARPRSAAGRACRSGIHGNADKSRWRMKDEQGRQDRDAATRARAGCDRSSATGSRAGRSLGGGAGLGAAA